MGDFLLKPSGCTDHFALSSFTYLNRQKSAERSNFLITWKSITARWMLPNFWPKNVFFFKYKFWCFLTVSRVTFLLKNFQPLIFNLDQKSWPNSIQLTLTFSFRKTFLSSVLKKKYFSISIFTVYSIGFAPYLPKVQWPPLGYTSLYFNNTYIIILRYTSKCLRYTSKCLRYTSGLLWMYCAYTSYWMVLTKW